MPALFLGIITLVLVIYGAIFYIKTKQTRIIAELDEQKSAVFNIPIDAVVLKLKQMHLSGKTKNIYESWANQWEIMVQDNLPEIEVNLEKAEQLSSQLKLLKSRREIDAAKELITASEQKAFQINEALQTIVDSESSSSQEIEKVNSNYQTLRNKVLTNSADYQDVFPTLQEKLAHIESLVAQFKTLMEEADYIEAKELLVEVDRLVGDIDKKLTLIPELYTTYTTDYNEQVEDIEDGYMRLVEQKFQFVDIDIPRAIDTLKETIHFGRQEVIDLQLEEATTRQEEVEKSIERLYDVMEKEIAAKDVILRLLPNLESKITQISQSNEHVLVEIDRISQNYELSDNELETATTFKEELVEVSDTFADYKESLLANRLVYTQAQEKLKTLSERVTTIDSTQAQMMKALSDLRQREQFAREQVDTFEFELRHMKRSLERQHLPGLSQLYLDLFLATTKRIEELADKLNRIKINMKEIDELVADCTQDVEKLDEATEMIIDNALLTEQLVQYSNRYRMEYASIDKAINVAINLYQYQYKYGEARKTLAQALDQIEDGASKRVEQLYQADKNRRLY